MPCAAAGTQPARRIAVARSACPQPTTDFRGLRGRSTGQPSCRAHAGLPTLTGSTLHWRGALWFVQGIRDTERTWAALVAAAAAEVEVEVAMPLERRKTKGTTTWRGAAARTQCHRTSDGQRSCPRPRRGASSGTGQGEDWRAGGAWSGESTRPRPHAKEPSCQASATAAATAAPQQRQQNQQRRRRTRGWNRGSSTTTTSNNKHNNDDNKQRPTRSNRLAHQAGHRPQHIRLT